MGYICSTCFLANVYLANADIYFDQSLRRVRSLDTLHPATSATVPAQILAVSKWKDWQQSPDEYRDSVLLDTRSDSQDAWIFRSPLNACMSHKTSSVSLAMGEVGCDNRLAEMSRACGYEVSNPALFVRAIEFSSKHRVTTVYSTRGGGGGGGDADNDGSGAFVLLTDSPPWI